MSSHATTDVMEDRTTDVAADFIRIDVTGDVTNDAITNLNI